jgi:hypothetical protein
MPMGCGIEAEILFCDEGMKKIVARANVHQRFEAYSPKRKKYLLIFSWLFPPTNNAI